MHDLTILLVGVIVGLGLGVIASAVRRTPVVGGPAPIAQEVRESRSAEEAAAASERAASIEPILAADAAGPQARAQSCGERKQDEGEQRVAKTGRDSVHAERHRQQHDTGNEPLQLLALFTS